MGVVFLDRDGVINANRAEYVRSWEEFLFLPGALDALQLLQRAAFRIFVVTNQAGVGRGLLTQAALDNIHHNLVRAAQQAGARIEAVRCCPHRADERCHCRKPQPGMLIDLAKTYRLELRQAYLVGDAASDIAAGQSVGCRTVLVRTGRGLEQLPAVERGACTPSAVADDLLAAAHWICAAEAQAPQRWKRATGRVQPRPALSVGAEEPTYPC